MQWSLKRKERKGDRKKCKRRRNREPKQQQSNKQQKFYMLSDFNFVHLKFSPKLHLHGIQYLLKSECLDHEAVDKFKQFESILMVRKNMFSKTDSHQDIEESGVSVGVEVNETNDESSTSTEQESDQD